MKGGTFFLQFLKLYVHNFIHHYKLGQRCAFELLKCFYI